MKNLSSGLHAGHVHLKVADLERSIAFYRDDLGLEVQTRMGDHAAFLSADGYHHQIGLNTWSSAGGTPPPKGHTGLFHVAFLYPSRDALARAVAHVVDAGVEIEGAADHGVSEAVYFSDPDGNGIEIYRDRKQEEWPNTPNSDLMLESRLLDLGALVNIGRVSLSQN